MRLKTFVLLLSALPASALTASCIYDADTSCGPRGTCKTGWTPPPGWTSSEQTGGAGGVTEGGSGGRSATGGAVARGGTSAQSGAAGEGGAGGAPTPIPCNGACGGATPVCDEELGKCVECVGTDDCAEGVCEPESQTCVECIEDAQCGKNAALCDTRKNVCVQCIDDSNCSDPTASRCVSNACTACATNADCKHIEGRGVCDAKECVQCTVSDEKPCQGNSCNPATRQCTETPVGTKADCEPCLADSECLAGNLPDPARRCVPMAFKGVKRAGGFCLRRGAKECQRPFLISVTETSLSGAPAEKYCGIDQENVRCEAVLDLSPSARTCTTGDDAACGCTRDTDGDCSTPGEGGLCRDFLVVKNQCTYRCGNDNHCPDGFKCAGDPIKFCQ